MSHLKERKEKNCLNCNAEVGGKFCHICGQENIHPKESVWHIVDHFFQDVTHFDGKFFSTIRLLIARPGFLSAEYAAGRRMSYLNPIRMYVFTSALFFLIFFSFVQKDEEVIEQPVSAQQLIDKLKQSKLALQKQTKDADDEEALPYLNTSINKIDANIALLQKDPSKADSIKNSMGGSGLVASLSNKYQSEAAYDSIQKKLPADKRDNWMERKMQLRVLAAKKKYNGNIDQIKAAYLHKFKHSFPQLLFLSLPFFAFTLKVLYIRRKQFYYVNHIIFTIHLYCAVFVLLLLEFGCNSLSHSLHWAILDWIQGILIIGIFFYLYKAMRNFYQQRRFKTIVKYMLLNFAMMIIITFLTMAMLVFTAFQV